jgi:hypothetical protein
MELKPIPFGAGWLGAWDPNHYIFEYLYIYIYIYHYISLYTIYVLMWNLRNADGLSQMRQPLRFSVQPLPASIYSSSRVNPTVSIRSISNPAPPVSIRSDSTVSHSD